MANVDVSYLMGQKLSGFSLLRSPDLAEQTIKKSLTEVDDQFIKEEGQRPGLRIKYGIKSRGESPIGKK